MEEFLQKEDYQPRSLQKGFLALKFIEKNVASD